MHHEEKYPPQYQITQGGLYKAQSICTVLDVKRINLSIKLSNI